MDKWLRNSNVVKVVALAIGVLLWVVVRLDVKTTGQPTTPVLKNTTISNVMVKAAVDETRYSIVSIEPKEVTVVLKGKESAIRKITPANLQIKVDATNQGAGAFYLPVGPQEALPSGVTAEIAPEKVRVVIEEKQTKEVPVIINVVGTPAEGYRAGQPIVNPNRVYVTVPASLKDTVESARAEVNIEKANEAVSKKVKLAAYDKYGNPMDAGISPPVVEVEVPITSPIKSMPLQIKWTGKPARGFAVSAVQQNVDQLAVYGPQTVLDRMEFYEGLEVDLTGLKEDKVFTLDIPLKNKAVKVEPSKVEIKVTVVPSVTRVLDDIPIKVSGQNDGMVTRFLEPENAVVSLRLEGAPGLLDKLKVQDIQAIVNVSNIPPGRVDLSLNVSLPPFIQIVEGPTKVSVEVAPANPKPTVEATGQPAAQQAQPSVSPSPVTSTEAGSPKPSAATGAAPAVKEATR